MTKLTKAKPEKTYEQLKNELDVVMLELQREDIGVDQALEHYQRGLELVRSIETYLKTAENKVSELKADFDAER